jgi:hypothetical protein
LRSSLALIIALIMKNRARIVKQRPGLRILDEQFPQYVQQSQHQPHCENQQQQNTDEYSHGALQCAHRAPFNFAAAAGAAL